jgi:hypothetical protein
MKALVQFSTGAGSAYVAYRAIERYGRRDVVLMTANTMVEDDDNWRFGHEVWMDLGQPEWVILADGRTPMEVGRDLRVVPNNRMAVCSRVLKRELLRKYIDTNFTPEDAVIMLGFDWTEEHRLVKAIPSWEPWKVEAPLMDPPYVDKAMILDFLRGRGIEPPRLYEMGFSHANCGGACVRGGQAQWKHLLNVDRKTYMKWELEERRTRLALKKDVAILRDRRGGTLKPMTLRDFRLRVEAESIKVDPDDWGACGCFMDED